MQGRHVVPDGGSYLLQSYLIQNYLSNLILTLDPQPPKYVKQWSMVIFLEKAYVENQILRSGFGTAAGLQKIQFQVSAHS